MDDDFMGPSTLKSNFNQIENSEIRIGSNIEEIFGSKYNELGDERKVQLYLYDNEIFNEAKKLTKVQYQQGFIEGSEYEPPEAKCKGINDGFNYSVNVGKCLGKVDCILKFKDIGFIELNEEELKKLMMIKENIEYNTFNVNEEENLSTINMLDNILKIKLNN